MASQVCVRMAYTQTTPVASRHIQSECLKKIPLSLARHAMYFVRLASASRRDAASPTRFKQLLPRFCSGLAAPHYEEPESSGGSHCISFLSLELVAMKHILLCCIATVLGLASESANAKCKAEAVAAKKAKAAVGATGKAVAVCKLKFKRTHFLRCRKARKAIAVAVEHYTRAYDQWMVCLKGCSWLRGLAQKTQVNYKACRKKHKLTFLLRCRKQKKKHDRYSKLFAQCQRSRKSK